MAAAAPKPTAPAPKPTAPAPKPAALAVAASQAVKPSGPPPAGALANVMKMVPEEQKQELREIMDIIDDDKNGSVSIKCISRIMRSFEFNFTEEEIFNTCKMMGINGPGIKIDDLFLAVGALTRQFHPLKVPFLSVDKDNQGFIPTKELKNVIAKALVTVPDEKINEFIGSAKVVDEKVSFANFCELCGMPDKAPVTKIFTNHVYAARFGDVCAVCKRLVKGVPTIVNQVYYHQECYACAGCNKILTAKDKTKVYQKRPLCETCKRPTVPFT